jgi:hypothetical protein
VAAPQPPPAQQAGVPQAGSQEQMAALQQQMEALQRQMAAQQGTPPTNQPG